MPQNLKFNIAVKKKISPSNQKQRKRTKDHREKSTTTWSTRGLEINRLCGMCGKQKAYSSLTEAGLFVGRKLHEMWTGARRGAVVIDETQV